MKRVTELALLVLLTSLLALGCGGSGGGSDDDAEDLCEDYCEELIDCSEGDGDAEKACVDACLEFVGEGDAEFDEDCVDAAIEAIECLADLSCDEDGCEDEFDDAADACEGAVFVCDDGAEIPVEFVCDDVLDCDSGEDEDFCP